MNSLTQDYPTVLRGEREILCLSLYQPTLWRHPANAQDPIWFRNLVKATENTLREKRIVRWADCNQSLGLGRNVFLVYEGNRDALYKLQPIEGAPYSADKQLGKEMDNRKGAHSAYGPTGTGAAAIYRI